MKSRYTMIAALAVLSLASCMKKEGSTTADSSTNAKADSMKNAYKAMSAAWDAGKADEFDKYVSANIVNHEEMTGMKPGLAGINDMIMMIKTAYPDMKSTTEDLRVDGDVLAARFNVSGTNTGPMMGMPATNKKITGVDGMEMLRWENGKFVERWGIFNSSKMMMQLGLMPMPGAPPAGDMSKHIDKKSMGKMKM